MQKATCCLEQGAFQPRTLNSCLFTTRARLYSFSPETPVPNHL